MPDPTAGSRDSQTVKAGRTTNQRGYDAGKKILGVKRHILLDTLGLVLVVVVHAANLQDRDGARLVLQKAQAQGKGSVPCLKRVWADGGYAGKLVEWFRLVGGGADIFLDLELSPPESALRMLERNSRSHGSPGDDSRDGPPPGEALSEADHLNYPNYRARA